MHFAIVQVILIGCIVFLLNAAKADHKFAGSILFIIGLMTINHALSIYKITNKQDSKFPSRRYSTEDDDASYRDRD